VQAAAVEEHPEYSRNAHITTRRVAMNDENSVLAVSELLNEWNLPEDIVTRFRGNNNGMVNFLSNAYSH